MESNEQTENDAKRVASVEQEIKKGQKDDKFEGYPRKEGKTRKWLHCEETAKRKFQSHRNASTKEDCCRRKKEKRDRKLKGMMSVSVFGPPCTIPKVDIVPRHCLSKQEYIDMLAAPSRKCPPECDKKKVIRRARPTTLRTKELARPPRQRLLMTLHQAATTLPPALLDNLVNALENETCLTPEQASRVSRRKKSSKKKGSPSKQRGSNIAVISGSVKKNSVSSQYAMAERFIKSILQWSCPIPKSEFSDIAGVLINRLTDVLEYAPSKEDQDRKSQQMRLLADVIACWISGVLLEVARDREAFLEERCKKMEEEAKFLEEQRLEEEEAYEEEEEEGEDEEDEEGKDKKDEDKDKDRDQKYEDTDEAQEKEEEEEEKVTSEEADMDIEAESEEKGEEEEEVEKDEEEEEGEVTVADEAVQYEASPEEPPEDAGAGETVEDQTVDEMEVEKPEETVEQELEQAMDADESAKEEIEQVDQVEVSDESKEISEEPEIAMELVEFEEQKDKDTQQKEVTAEALIGTMGDLFKTQLPFLTFDKIISTLYNMMEGMPENTGEDPVTNSIHRAIYEKLTGVVSLEKPELLTDELKYKADVVCGKMAIWLKKMLTESQIAIAAEFVPGIESEQLREYIKWLCHISDAATHWSIWLRGIIERTVEMKGADINRGDWQDWTKSVDSDALRWRRFHLQTLHQAERNRGMMTGRKVDGITGEQVLRATDLHA